MANLEIVKTPWNPSVTATARVLDPLPVPEKCPHCGGAVILVQNEVIYGCNYGDWPWAYMCSNKKDCDSYVGLHPFTSIPLGTLATKDMRTSRKNLHQVFDPIWKRRGKTRKEAYTWLSKKLRIPLSQCHVAMFDIKTCEKAIKAIEHFPGISGIRK